MSAADFHEKGCFQTEIMQFHTIYTARTIFLNNLKSLQSQLYQGLKIYCEKNLKVRNVRDKENESSFI